jgi:DNA polymerase-3 subunit alpha
MITADAAGQTVRLVALVTAVRTVLTKRQQTMAIATIEDEDGEAELVLFPDCYERCGEAVTENAIVEATARVDVRHDQVQLVAEQVTPFDPEASRAPRQRLVVRLRQTDDLTADIAAMHAVRDVLWQHEGEDEIRLEVPTAAGATHYRPIRRGIDVNPDLLDDLRAIVGPDGVRVEQDVDDATAGMAAVA